LDSFFVTHEKQAHLAGSSSQLSAFAHPVAARAGDGSARIAASDNHGRARITAVLPDSITRF
jgi:hypothetical protein